MQINVRFSIQLFLVALISVSITATCVQGGEPVVDKNVAPPPPELYGTGWYAAIDMGANVFQNRGGSRTFTDEFGDTLTIDPKNDVGFFGGVKGGYVFGTGVIRPTLEGDFFYNGFRGGANTTLNIDGVVTRGSTSTSFINTGAFMGNALLRFAFGKF
jgi:hypothetical protein